MINLLPLERQRMLSREYRLRAGVVFLFLASCVLVVALILLLSFSVLLRMRIGAAQEMTSTAVSSGEHPSSFEKIFADIEERIALLEFSEGEKEFFPTELVDTLLQYNREGIRYTAFAYTNAGGKRTVTLRGVAKDRRTFISFEEELKREKLFEGVSSPVSELGKKEDIVFSISIIIKTDMVENKSKESRNSRADLLSV